MYIGTKIREEAYNCNKCASLREHLEVCTLTKYKMPEIEEIKILSNRFFKQAKTFIKKQKKLQVINVRK